MLARAVRTFAALGLVAIVGCSSAVPAEGEGTAAGALDNGTGTDLASLAASTTARGDMPGVPFIPAAAGGTLSGRSAEVQFVVIHDIEGTGRSAVSTFRAASTKTSAHYIVDKLGVVVQMVRESDTSLNTGSLWWNGAAIGIEHSGMASEDGYTEAEYDASAKLVAAIVTRYSIPVDREHIVGHNQVPSVETEAPACSAEATTCGGRNHHQDPGKYWDWDAYLAKVQAAVDATTP